MELQFKDAVKCHHNFSRYMKFIESIKRINLTRKINMIERHHIIPKSMGGSDDVSNMIAFTPREHYIAHLILMHAFKNKVMTYAFITMTGRDIKINSRLYDSIKIKYIHNISGKNAYWWGKSHTEKTKAILRTYNGPLASMWGKYHTEEAKDKMRYAHLIVKENKKGMYGKTVVYNKDGNKEVVCVNELHNYISIHKNTVCVINEQGNISKIAKDDPLYESGQLKGVTHGMVSTKDVNGNRFYVSTNDTRYVNGELIEKSASSCMLDGVFFFSLKHAASLHNISVITLRKRIFGTNPKWKGWVYTKIIPID